MSATHPLDNTTLSPHNTLPTEDNSDDDQYNNGHLKKKKRKDGKDKQNNNETITIENKNPNFVKEKNQKSGQSSLPLTNTTMAHDQPKKQQTKSVHAPNTDSADEFSNLEIEQAKYNKPQLHLITYYKVQI